MFGLPRRVAARAQYVRYVTVSPAAGVSDAAHIRLLTDVFSVFNQAKS